MATCWAAGGWPVTTQRVPACSAREDHGVSCLCLQPRLLEAEVNYTCDEPNCATGQLTLLATGYWTTRSGPSGHPRAPCSVWLSTRKLKPTKSLSLTGLLILFLTKETKRCTRQASKRVVGGCSRGSPLASTPIRLKGPLPVGDIASWGGGCAVSVRRVF